MKKDLIFEGIETPSMMFHLTNTTYGVKKDLIFEGIETMVVFSLMMFPCIVKKDLIFEGIETS